MADVEKVKIEGVPYDIKDPNAVSIQSQSLTAAQQAQARTNIGVSAATDVYTKTETDTLLNGKINTTAKGTASGVAELDANGKVPSSQLPSFVDDVVEGYYKTDNDRFYEESTFTTLIEPVAGKSWVDIPTNKSYRWTGSVYVRVDEGVQIGETADTAYAGNKGKANADAIAAIKNGTSIDSFGDVETALADKISKSQTAGLVKNDGTIDTTNYVSDISGKTDKVSGATNGNFAGLDANGNLVDSGKKASDFTQVQSDWSQTNSSEKDFIKNKPPISIGHGMGGNIEGGTGGTVYNYATWNNSVAYGYGANATADYALAYGQFVSASHNHEVAFGKYNISSADTAFSIGDGAGTGATPNHNLMELKTNGKLFLNNVAVASEKEISELYAILGLYGNDVYGLQVDFENYTYTRLAGAVGKTAGTDFNSLAPWSGMKRCNLADDGTVNAYYGDASYIEDGSNGQVMVEIPKFYYRVMPIKLDPIGGTVGGYHMRKGNYYISATKYEGFKTHPAFIKPDGTEVDKAYVSAYEGSIYDVSAEIYILDDAQVADFTATTGDKLCSIAGAKPCSGATQNLTRINAEQLAVNRGTGWHTLNSKAISAVQMLFAVEYASFNSQSAIGKGVVDKSSGTGNESVATGATASLGNTSGMADGTNGLVSISYRGIENFWGNIWKFCVDINMYGDGTMQGGIPYICNDYNYAESTVTGYTSAGFTVANANNFISAFGYNADYDWLFIASETGGTADSNYPVGDYEDVSANLNGYRISLFAGGWYRGSQAGIFCEALYGPVTSRARDIGSRLIYV